MIKLIRVYSPLLAIFLAGCTIGPNMGRLAPLEYGRGIEVRLVRDGRPTVSSYEVLSVEDDGLYLHRPASNSGESIFWIPYENISRADFPGLTRLNFERGKAPAPSRMHELRLASRYPQGIDADLREAILAAYDQEEVVTLP